MHDLLQNPAVLLVLVVAFARFFGKRLAAGKKSPAGAGQSADEAERTRRVREEVARKIAERRREAAPPVFAAAPAGENRPAIASVQRATAGLPSADIAGVLADQQKLVDQIRALDATGAPPGAAAAGIPRGAVPADEGHGGWLRELGDPRGARRAMVLREVLGAPRGLTVEGCLWR